MPDKNLLNTLIILAFIILILTASAFGQFEMASFNERFVTSDLEKIAAAEGTYYLTSPSHNYGGYEQLYNAGLIGTPLGTTGQGHGYRYPMIITIGGQNQSPLYKVYATPLTYGKSGRRSFYMDQTGIIRGADIGGGNASDIYPAIAPFCNESTIPNLLQNINSSEAAYFATYGVHINFGATGTLQTLNLVDTYIANGQKCGYRINIVATMAVVSASPEPSTYFAKAVPISYGLTGFNSYYTDETGVVRGADHAGGNPSPGDPPLQNRSASRKGF